MSTTLDPIDETETETDELDESDVANDTDTAEVANAEVTDAPAPIAATTAPTVLQSTVVTPAILDIAPVAPSGIFSGLAPSIEVGASILLAICKRKDGSLVVSVQPTKSADEKDDTVLPFQVAGSPDELDSEFLDALRSYVPARVIATTSAKAIAEKIVSASNTTNAAAAKEKDRAANSKAKSDAKYNKPTKSATASTAVKPVTTELGKVLLSLSPPSATLVVHNDANTIVAFTAGAYTELPVGKYTAKASAEGYEDNEIVFEVNSKSAKTASLSLVPALPQLF